MIDQNLTDSNKAIVRSFYEGGTDSNAKDYGKIFSPAFTVTAPDYLPWGGTSSLTPYLKDVLPQVTKVLDFTRCNIVSIIGENESVVIVIKIGVFKTESSIKISEHWVFKDSKAESLCVAYFEPKVLMEFIARNKVELEATKMHLMF